MSSSQRRLSTVLAARCALAALLTAGVVGCNKGDPDENFRLWSNNEAGWEEMAAYVADRGNDTKQRTRALEVLIDDGGQPSQVTRVASKAPDKIELLLGLQPALQKMLENPNLKKQGHAKRVLFDMLGVLPEDKKASTRKMIAKWAFGDLSADDSAARITEKLGQRLRPEEIEALGDEGVTGAEIMLGKAVARDGVVAYLQALKTPAAKAALINGMRRYHKIKNVKVTEGDLAAIQSADSVDGLAYFLELYERLLPSTHPDDKAAASLAISAAIQWTDKAESKPQIKAGFDAKLKPIFERLLVGQNADDRWWSAQMLVNYDGVAGLKAALAKLPDDGNYGQASFAQNDVKMMITDLCSKDVKGLGADVVRPVLEASLKTARLIEHIVAIRCLTALGDDAALVLLRGYDKKDNHIVDPIIVPQTRADVTVSELASAGVEIVEYQRATDKLAAEGKVDAETAKWRKHYAGYSFERRGKTLIGFAEERAADKVAKAKGAPAK